MATSTSSLSGPDLESNNNNDNDNDETSTTNNDNNNNNNNNSIGYAPVVTRSRSSAGGAVSRSSNTSSSSAALSRSSLKMKLAKEKLDAALKLKAEKAKELKEKLAENLPTRVKEEDGSDRILMAGMPNYTRCDNTLITSKYTLLNFFPNTIVGQFRRFANMYFLIVGIIMGVGQYTDLFASAFSPVTTLGPLAIFVSISLLMEGTSDRKRHRNDFDTNNYQCVVLENSKAQAKDQDTFLKKSVQNAKIKAQEQKKRVSRLLEGENTNNNNNQQSKPIPWDDVLIAGNNIMESMTMATAATRIKFNSFERKDIRQGNLIVIRNREMVPADTILLASSGDRGCTYIETSSIDGETNLKLRVSAKSKKDKASALVKSHETMQEAVTRIATFTALGYPDLNFTNAEYEREQLYRIGLITTEPPDAHVNTFSGTIAIPLDLSTWSSKTTTTTTTTNQNANTINDNDNDNDNNDNDNDEENQQAPSPPHFGPAADDEDPNTTTTTDPTPTPTPTNPQQQEQKEIIPLGAEHLLLRGAVLRNTEWAIGVTCFTGTDTKLSQNSIEAPSKFSQLDLVTNSCVIVMIWIELLCILFLSVMATFKQAPDALTGTNLWYLSINQNRTTAQSNPNQDVWPYLPDLEPPKWEETGDTGIQIALTYVTLLSYFVPLSMYFTLELVNFFLMYLVYVDLEMYDATTDTNAEPRSTIITDLGQVQYIFSDKTGTLTQNVMKFKRCSIDGLVFGAPVEKTRPKEATTQVDDDKDDDNNNGGGHPFHPTKQVLVGQIHITESGNNSKAGADGEGTEGLLQLETSKGMTVNAELFLRVMSLCHTVVVEKDLDLPTQTKKQEEEGNGAEEEDGTGTGTGTPSDEEAFRETVQAHEKSADGAPFGYAYQAESPDEGALVSDASKTFGFQVISRDSRGIQLKCDHPTLFRNEELVQGLKSGRVDLKKVSAESASGKSAITQSTRTSIGSSTDHDDDGSNSNIETWSVLAINQFDSTRKRMSILLRSPPKFGSVAILLCKGADSAMLDPEICTSTVAVDDDATTTNYDDDDEGATKNQEEAGEESEWEVAKMLGIEAHLGEFASEGLRTLVLGVRFLTDQQCEEWMVTHTAAAGSMKDRDSKLTQCAFQIEKEIHIVGATAIEDKLQDEVPDTIATLAKAGIKLWVLTGDKRETAIEIGYSTQVLTPQMHLTEVADRGSEFVRAQCAMEFMRLVKAGKLPLYQRAAVDQPDQQHCVKNVMFSIGKVLGACSLSLKRIMLRINIYVRTVLRQKRKMQLQQLERLDEVQSSKEETPNDLKRRRNVRNRAEDIIKQYAQLHPVIHIHEPQLSTDVLPPVFNRAQSAKETLDRHRSQGKLTSVDERASRLSLLTAQELAGKQQQQQQQQDNPSGEPILDDDMLSLQSFYPSKKDQLASDFDKKKRTLFERMFAVDRDVRKGRLIKHLKREKRKEVLASLVGTTTSHAIVPSGDGPRALVIEGAALEHLQGDIELEELIFNIASQCGAVIACRVTPRQKAQLVRMVRHYVVPEPVTLAIGDGANDCGMIYEAHVGIGISGKEGKQAVNASDFSIGQFRFLEPLILYHGRWGYMRTSMVVLYCFYKNFVIAGLLVLYNIETMYSGTSLFDQWLNSGFSVFAFAPILILGMFDRDLEKSYISKNPEVYKPTRQKELITARTLSRWIFMAIAHIIILYFGHINPLSQGGGNTSAFLGLMQTKGNTVGDGETNDWQSMGTTIFTSMMLLLAYKVLYESRSIINGHWPAITCSKDSEGYLSRLPYTWYGILIGSFLFYVVFLYTYTGYSQTFGVSAGTAFPYISVPQHVFSTSSLNYVLIVFIPISGMAFDVAGKVFSNFFYPSQTQIHIELEAKELGKARKAKKKN